MSNEGTFTSRRRVLWSLILRKGESLTLFEIRQMIAQPLPTPNFMYND